MKIKVKKDMIQEWTKDGEKQLKIAMEIKTHVRNEIKLRCMIHVKKTSSRIKGTIRTRQKIGKYCMYVGYW